MAFVNGLPHIDRPSTLPENTHDDVGGSGRLPKILSDVVERLSRLAASTPDNIGGRAVQPGNVPDRVDHFSGLPEKMPGNADASRRLHVDQPDNVSRIFLLRRNASDTWICRVAGVRSAGDMGSGVVYPFYTTFCRRSLQKSFAIAEILGLTPSDPALSNNTAHPADLAANLTIARTRSRDRLGPASFHRTSS